MEFEDGDRELEDVRKFHQKFGQLDSEYPVHLTKRKLMERANFMLEELLEFADAAGLTPYWDEKTRRPQFTLMTCADQELPLQADALIDLVYVAKGTAAMMGLPWRTLWDDVQRANMEKVKGPTHRNMGHGADITKPTGWHPPETERILVGAGYFRHLFEENLGRPPIDDAKCTDDEGAPRG